MNSLRKRDTNFDCPDKLNLQETCIPSPSPRLHLLPVTFSQVLEYASLGRK